MTGKEKNKNKNEEVDLIVFFNLIGNALNKVFTFIGSILRAIFSVLIHTIKLVVKSWKIILTVVVFAAIAGYALEKNKSISYQSSMLVQPYFGSKYQLINNIKYFNSLIKEKNHDELRTIFVADDSTNIDVNDISGFEVNPGSESENERFLQYQDFLKLIDSSAREQITFDEYKDNRNIYSGDIFLITAYSNNKNIFKKLEKGILSAFINEYSAEEFKKKEQIREIQKQNLLAQIQAIDSLKSFYIRLRTNESQKSAQNISLGDLSLSTDSKSSTREYELLEKENEIRDQLNTLEEQKIEEDKVYDVISSFQGIGEVESSLLDRYSLIFPALAFILLCLLYLIVRIIIYAKKYKD